MGPTEIAWRLQGQLRARAWRRYQVRPTDRTSELDLDLALGPVGPNRERTFKAALQNKACVEIPPAARADLIAAADAILAGRWRILGEARTDIMDPDWFLDPVTGRRAPQSDYCFQVNHRSAAVVSNVKHVWELSRMQHTVVLAGAFAVTKDERYSKQAAMQLHSWWRENPFLSGINWTGGIEVGLRLISWVWIRRLLEGWSGAAELFEQNPQAVRQIWWHQRYLDAFRSRGSSANNHLIAEAAGHLVAALGFPWFPESSKWAAAAAETLEGALQTNTFPSGLNREMASHYHGFVAELGLLAAAEADRAGQPLSEETWRLLARMFDAAASTLDCQLRAPRQGDGDDARVLPLEGQRANYWHSLLAIGKAVFGAPAWWPSVSPTVSSVLIGSLVSDHHSIPRPSVRPFHFADAGLTLLRDDNDGRPELWCRCDAGPHGFLSIAAHAHADALSLEVRHDGVDILADPGTYCYHDQSAWRTYFRSTLAHNTVEIANRNQSVSGGPFMWLRHARTRLVDLRTNRDGNMTWCAEHDGYEVLKPPALHRRTVTFSGVQRRVEIRDEIHSGGTHLVRLAFHLGPCVSAGLSDHVAELRWRRAEDTATATIHLPNAMTWRLYHGAMHPILGWYSAGFGEKQPSTTLLGVATCHGSAQFESILQFST